MVLMVESQILGLQWKQAMSKQCWTAEIKHPFSQDKVTLWWSFVLFWLRFLRVTHLTSIVQTTAKELRILICVVHLCHSSHYKYPMAVPRTSSWMCSAFLDTWRFVSYKATMFASGSETKLHAWTLLGLNGTQLGWTSCSFRKDKKRKCKGPHVLIWYLWSQGHTASKQNPMLLANH